MAIDFSEYLEKPDIHVDISNDELLDFYQNNKEYIFKSIKEKINKLLKKKAELIQTTGEVYYVKELLNNIKIKYTADLELCYITNHIAQDNARTLIQDSFILKQCLITLDYKDITISVDLYNNSKTLLQRILRNN